MKQIEIIVGDHHSKIVGPRSVIEDLKEILCYENDIQVRRASRWKIPQYNYLIKDDGVFFSGLLTLVVKYLKAYKLNYTVQDIRRIKEAPDISDVAVRLKKLKYCNPPVKLRDYQLDAVMAGLEHTRGLIYAATGAGKSVIMAALIIAWHKKTLVLVDSKDLAAQLRNGLQDFLGEPVGLIGSGVFDEQRVTVGMAQTLSKTRAGAKKKKIKSFLESVEYIVMDECHHVQADSWRRTIRSCTNASVFHGYTATPHTSTIKGEDGKENRNILLRAYIGPVVYKITTRSLIEMGWLAKPTIKFINNELYWDEQPLLYTDEYTRIIVEDEERNRLACKVIFHNYKLGRQSIGFITRIDHGEAVAKMLIDEFGVPEEHIAFVSGEMDSGSRVGNLKSFKDGNLPILLGTVLNEGLDFFCDVGVNISGGDSIRSTIQKLGRILRKVKNPETGEVDLDEVSHVDYYELEDLGHPYFSNHSMNRRQIYLDEGHKVEFISKEDL